MSANIKYLHWTQRIALVRHNLHAASRSADFGFFKTLQAVGFVEGTNHVATLSAEMGDDADIVLAAMDNLNAGLAYVHQDAFKMVYDGLKNRLALDESHEPNMSKLYVDITMRKSMADMAIDKMASSAMALIGQQPEKAQDSAASVWITGITIIADSMDVSLHEMELLEEKLNDFIRLEESWNTVKASVVGAVMGLRGVYRLMDPANPQWTPSRPSTRNASIASASGAVFRRLSNAFVGISNPDAATTNSSSRRNSSISISPYGPSTTASGRNNSFSSTLSHNFRWSTPNYVRNSVGAGCPTSLPRSSSSASLQNSAAVRGNFERHHLSMIPPTPATGCDELLDPFDTEVPPVPLLPKTPEEEISPGQSVPAMPAPIADMSLLERRRGSLGVV